VEASDAAETARLLIRKNNMSHIITVIKGKVEEVELPEMVDVVVSEPIGFLLVHERMLESYVAARDRFVKPEILNSNQKHFMYPAQGTICVLPFTDPALVQDVATKSQFWRTSDFYGVDLSCLERHALAQNFSQPVIGYFDTNILIASEDEIVTHAIDFRTAHVRKDFVDIDIPFRFCISRTTIMHGLGCWFDADFFGSENHVVLSTSPKFPGTHWYQVRLLLSRPLAVNVGQIVVGHMRMKVNAKFSYDIELEAEIENVPQVPRSVNHIFLHDPYYHYLGASQNGAMAHDAVFVDAYHDLAKDFVMPNGNENHEDAKMLV
jgi:histone-arginine methyltransferase CARM1